MHENDKYFPILLMDDTDLRRLEQVFELPDKSLRCKKSPSRLLLNGLPLAHEIHYALRLRWWGWSLTVYQVDTFGVGTIGGQPRTWKVPDYPAVAIAEPGRTSVLGRFRLDKTVRRTKPGSTTEVDAQHQLSRRWWDK